MTCAHTLPKTQMWLSIFAAAKLNPKMDMRIGVIIAPPPMPATEENTLTANIRRLPEASRGTLPWKREDLKQRAAGESGHVTHWHAELHDASLDEELQRGEAEASEGQMTLGISRAHDIGSK